MYHCNRLSNTCIVNARGRVVTPFLNVDAEQLDGVVIGRSHEVFSKVTYGSFVCVIMVNRCDALLSGTCRDFGMSPVSTFVKQGLVRERRVYEDSGALLRAGWVSISGSV